MRERLRHPYRYRLLQADSVLALWASPYAYCLKPLMDRRGLLAGLEAGSLGRPH